MGDHAKLGGHYALMAQYMYQQGIKDGALWRDAEEFLDYLDTAAVQGENSPNARRLTTLIRLYHQQADVPQGERRDYRDLFTLAVMAKKLLAAECSAFLVESDMAGERWDPFHRWAGMLKAHDSVITFNYDLVVETLFSESAAKHENKNANLHVAKPSDVGQKPSAGIQFLKLHGSVSWRLNRTGSAPHVVDSGLSNVLDVPDNELVIASPGPSKKTATSSYLMPLWEAARDAIKDARAVVFVGYRFPPSDAFSRGWLLKALTSNFITKPLTVHTVLGPNLSEPHQVRMHGLLHHALSRKDRSDLLKATGPNYAKPGPPH